MKREKVLALAWKLAITLGLILATPPLIQQCGADVADRTGDGVKKSEDVLAKATPTKIPISVLMINIHSSLGLATSIEFHMRLTGCASGYTIDPIPLDATSIEVFEGDTGCFVQLTQIVKAGSVLETISAFMTHGVGERAEYCHPQDENDRMDVTVLSQLSSPVVATDTVRFGYWSYDGRESVAVSTETLKNSNTMTVVGVPAPLYKLSAVKMEKAVANTVPITFSMDCLVDPVLDGAEFYCDGQKYSQLQYVFIEAPANVDLAYLNGQFSSTTPSVSTNATLSSTGFNLNISLSLSQVIKGKTYLLVLRNAGGSYSYFQLMVKNGSLTGA